MKRLCTVIISFAVATGAAWAQESFFGGGSRSGFIAPTARYTSLGGNWGLMAGLRGGLIMNKSLSLGGGLYGLGGTAIKSDVTSVAGNTMYHSFTYGGFEIEYIIDPDSRMHYSILGLLGIGSASLRDTKVGVDTDANTVYIFEPGVGVIINLTETIRLGAGLHYRFVSGADTANLKNSDINGPSLSLMLKFGGI